MRAGLRRGPLRWLGAALFLVVCGVALAGAAARRAVAGGPGPVGHPSSPPDDSRGPGAAPARRATE